MIGPQGNQGEAITLQVSEIHIKWKYESDSECQELISLELLTGAKGDTGESGQSGTDGREVLFQVSDGEQVHL